MILFCSVGCLLHSPLMQVHYFQKLRVLSAWLENVPALVKASPLYLAYYSSLVALCIKYRLRKSYLILLQNNCSVVR